MKRCFAVFSCVVGFLLCGCASKLVRVIGKPQSTVVLKQDTIWEGVIEVDGPVFIPKGVTLTVEPGTIVRFSNRRAITDEIKRHDIIDGTGLKVEGKLIAAGTRELPIFFTSNQQQPKAGDWDKILINHSQGSVFDYCYIEYADFAIHAHFSEAVVKNSVIRFNNEGFRLGESRFTISYNRIEFNKSRGINFRASRHKIFRNLISQNAVGIFLYEKNQKTVISENNFLNNTDYDLRLGDFHGDEIKLQNNWWGTTIKEIIAEKIWDHADDEMVGRAIIQPADRPRETKQ